MKKTVLVSAFHLVFVSVAAKILSFAVRILLARELSSEAMNLYALASPTMVFLIAIVQQGIPSALSKLTAQQEGSKPLFASAMITMLTTAAVMSVYVLVLPYFAGGILHHAELVPVLRAIIPLLPFVALSGLLKGYLYGRQQHFAANNAQLYEEGSRLLFLLAFFAAWDIRDPAMLAAVAMISVSVGEIVSCLYMMLRLRVPFARARRMPSALRGVSLSAMREVLSISMPMMGISTGSQPVISYNYGAKNTGLIKRAEKIILCMCLAFTGIMFALSFAIAAPFVSLFTSDGQIAAKSVWGIRVFMIGVIPLSFQYAFVDGLTARPAAVFRRPVHVQKTRRLSRLHPRFARVVRRAGGIFCRTRVRRRGGDRQHRGVPRRVPENT